MLPHPELDFRRTPVTLLIAAVVVAIELVCTFDPGRRDVYYSLWKMGLLSTIWSGELWRPFTTSLLHGYLLHAAFNVYWLLIFGRVLEPFFGSFRYLLILVLLAFTSMVPSFLVSNFDAALDEQIRIVGLSGIVYGLFGIVWMGRQVRQDMATVCTEETVSLFIAWFFLCIILTYAKIMNVANVAHGLGLIVGALIGKALFEPNRKWLWRALAVIVSLVLLAPTFAAPRHPLYENYLDAVRPRRAPIEMRIIIEHPEEKNRVREQGSEEGPANNDHADDGGASDTGETTRSAPSGQTR
jgi:membrane associated rhomboid family serine protease